MQLNFYTSYLVVKNNLSILLKIIGLFFPAYKTLQKNSYEGEEQPTNDETNKQLDENLTDFRGL